MQYAVNQQAVNQAAAPVQESRWSNAAAWARKVGKSLVTWQWTRRLLYWIVLSAGTASELFFLIAAIWVSVNANVHQFMLTFLTEQQTIHFTYLATTGFVALPECIVFLSMITTINHIKMWKIGGASSVLWSILYGVPTLVFLTLSLVTIGCSVASVTFTMPTFFVVVRALAAFMFAFTAFMYHFLGAPQEKERLAEKDGIIASLRAEMNASLQAFTSEKKTMLANIAQEKNGLLEKIAMQNDEIASLKNLLAQTQKGFTELHNAMNKSEDAALQAFGEACISWLKTGDKSATVDEISRYTGLSTRRINNAIKAGKLQTSTRNKELILKASLISWLKNLSPDRETDTDIPALRLVNQ